MYGPPANYVITDCVQNIITADDLITQFNCFIYWPHSHAYTRNAQAVVTTCMFGKQDRFFAGHLKIGHFFAKSFSLKMKPFIQSAYWAQNGDKYSLSKQEWIPLLKSNCPPNLYRSQYLHIINITQPMHCAYEDRNLPRDQRIE